MTGSVVDRLNVALEGRYRIERELGEGGMATVYLAEDLKHDRRVALKVLRPDLSAALGAERFLHEIKVTAGLQHPGILPLYDSGESDGVLYYVMPYVEGESLRERLNREGELPIGEAVRVLREVADALASAHRKGVVHRDIKPANVMFSEGHALVADFGVAKALSDARDETSDSSMTEAGTAIGTPIYMSPEQAAAEPRIDHRSDIYGLGALGYELLSGRPPFEGRSSSAVLAAIMAEDPDPVSRYRAAVPAELDGLIMKCLAKKPADRWQSAYEVGKQLDLVAAAITGGTPLGSQAVAKGLRGHRVATAAIVGMLAATGVVAWAIASRDADPRVEVANIRQITRATGLEFDPALSPDGGEVAYAAGHQGDIHIYVRDLEGGRPIALTADLQGEQTGPRWTPDGREILFFDARTDVRRVPRFGGATVDAASPYLHGDSVLVFRPPDSVFVVSGGNTSPAGVLPAGAHSLAWSPDGSRIAFVTGNSFYTEAANLGNIAPSTLWSLELSPGSEPAQLTTSQSLNAAPVWLPDGQGLLFVSDREGPRDLYTLALDRGGRPGGDPVRLTTGLNPHSVSLSADGSLAAYAQLSYRTNIWAIELADSGSVPLSRGRAVTRGNQTVEAHDISPDGRLIAFDSNLDGAQDIYVREIEGTEPRRLTTDPGYDFHPSFSPDGREIVFHSTRHGSRDLFIIGTDGRNERRLTADPGEEMNPEFSPDGLRIAYRDRETPGLFVIERASTDAPWSEPRQVSPLGANTSWSPDSRRLVAPDGNRIVVVSAEPSGEANRTVFDGAGVLSGVTQAIWSEDGREIYFVAIRTDGAGGYFAVDTAGGQGRPIVTFDEPSMTVQFSPSLADGVLYLSVAERESDIYAMDLVIR